jgi:hypothetical protein
MGVHESQSLFWECRVARGVAFARRWQPRFAEALGADPWQRDRHGSVHGFWRALNPLSPGWGLACSLIGGGRPEGPFCLAATPEPRFAGPAGVHVEHQGGRHRLHPPGTEGLGEGVKALGAKPARPAVVELLHQGA